jgi:hypothetical protein
MPRYRRGVKEIERLAFGHPVGYVDHHGIRQA